MNKEMCCGIHFFRDYFKDNQTSVVRCSLFDSTVTDGSDSMIYAEALSINTVKPKVPVDTEALIVKHTEEMEQLISDFWSPYWWGFFFMHLWPWILVFLWPIDIGLSVLSDSWVYVIFAFGFVVSIFFSWLNSILVAGTWYFADDLR